MSDSDKDLARMQELVQESLQRGRVPAAKAALSRSWRDNVPELPVRFSVMLVRLRQEDCAAVLRRLRANHGGRPPLRLLRARDGSFQVVTKRGKRLVLGELPRGEVKLLRDLGSEADLYRPELLEVRHDSYGQVRAVSIEMVRRKNPEKAGDRLPLQIHEALEAVIAEDSEDDLEI